MYGSIQRGASKVGNRASAVVVDVDEQTDFGDCADVSWRKNMPEIPRFVHTAPCLFMGSALKVGGVDDTVRANGVSAL